MAQTFIDSIILGVIEGVTEFLPVSSTGHMILAKPLLHLDTVLTDVFIVVIQLGAILAVMFARRARVWSMATGFFTNAYERTMALKILTAFFPAVIVGLLLHDYIKMMFLPVVVATSLIIGGIVMLMVERAAPRARMDGMDNITFKTALGIGLCQLVALIPGVSRAGASIVGAQYLGVERKTATEFSFFLAMPTMFGAAAYDLYKNRDLLSSADIPVFAIGLITAFISALIVVNMLIKFVGKHGFTPFAWYRIGLGLLCLVLLSFGWL
jgi:undecaprenyl-diphosphatase